LRTRRPGPATGPARPRQAKSDTQSLCTPANGEGDGRGNVKQEHVFNGNQRAKCETRERRGGKMGRWTQKAPQKPSGDRHAWCAQAALRERLPATAHAVKPLPARSGRCAGQARHTARGAMEPAAEVLHAVDPGFAADPQTFPATLHARMAASSRSFWHRYLPSQNLPRQESSRLARRAIGSLRQRMNQERLANRRRRSANASWSAVSIRSSCGSGTAGRPSSSRRLGNRRHQRRATSSSDHVSTTSGLVRRTA